MERTLLATIAALVLCQPRAHAEPVDVGNVRAEIRTGKMAEAKGKRYLRVSFTVTRRDVVPPEAVVLVRGITGTGAARRSDEVRALSLKLAQVPRGEARDVVAPLFMETGLPADPGRFEISFHVVVGRERDGPRVAQYCVDGHDVAPGACGR